MSFLENKVPHVYEVLKEKESAIEQLRQEIKALRLVCQILHDEGDSDPRTFESGIKPPDIEPEGIERIQKADVVRPADEREASLARIRARLDDARGKNAHTGGGRSALLRFRQAALGASRAFLKRILDSRSPEREPQQKTIRNFFERFGRPNAA